MADVLGKVSIFSYKSFILRFSNSYSAIASVSQTWGGEGGVGEYTSLWVEVSRVVHHDIILMR